MAWHGRSLWVGNSPDLTIARDFDGDGVADEYVTRPDETLPYFPQPDEIRNVTLFCEKRNFSGRVSFIYTDGVMTTLGSAPAMENWSDPQKRVDAQLRYWPNSPYAVTLAARNLTQEQEYYSYGRGGPLRETDRIGRNFTFGVNVNY